MGMSNTDFVHVQQAYVHSAIIAFVTIGAFTHSNEVCGEVMGSNEVCGRGASMWEIGTTVMVAVVMVANIRLHFETKSWTGPYVTWWMATIVGFVITLGIFNSVGFVPVLGGTMVGQIPRLLKMTTFW